MSEESFCKQALKKKILRENELDEFERLAEEAQKEVQNSNQYRFQQIKQSNDHRFTEEETSEDGFQACIQERSIVEKLKSIRQLLGLEQRNNGEQNTELGYEEEGEEQHNLSELKKLKNQRYITSEKADYVSMNDANHQHFYSSKQFSDRQSKKENDSFHLGGGQINHTQRTADLAGTFGKVNLSYKEQQDEASTLNRGIHNNRNQKNNQQQNEVEYQGDKFLVAQDLKWEDKENNEELTEDEDKIDTNRFIDKTIQNFDLNFEFLQYPQDLQKLQQVKNQSQQHQNKLSTLNAKYQFENNIQDDMKQWEHPLQQELSAEQKGFNLKQFNKIQSDEHQNNLPQQGQWKKEIEDESLLISQISNGQVNTSNGQISAIEVGQISAIHPNQENKQYSKGIDESDQQLATREFQWHQLLQKDDFSKQMVAKKSDNSMLGYSQESKSNKLNTSNRREEEYKGDKNYEELIALNRRLEVENEAVKDMKNKLEDKLIKQELENHRLKKQGPGTAIETSLKQSYSSKDTRTNKKEKVNNHEGENNFEEVKENNKNIANDINNYRKYGHQNIYDLNSQQQEENYKFRSENQNYNRQQQSHSQNQQEQIRDVNTNYSKSKSTQQIEQPPIKESFHLKNQKDTYFNKPYCASLETKPEARQDTFITRNIPSENQTEYSSYNNLSKFDSEQLKRKVQAALEESRVEVSHECQCGLKKRVIELERSVDKLNGELEQQKNQERLLKNKLQTERNDFNLREGMLKDEIELLKSEVDITRQNRDVIVQQIHSSSNCNNNLEQLIQKLIQLETDLNIERNQANELARDKASLESQVEQNNQVRNQMMNQCKQQMEDLLSQELAEANYELTLLKSEFLKVICHFSILPTDGGGNNNQDQKKKTKGTEHTTEYLSHNSNGNQKNVLNAEYLKSNLIKQIDNLNEILQENLHLKEELNWLQLKANSQPFLQQGSVGITVWERKCQKQSEQSRFWRDCFMKLKDRIEFSLDDIREKQKELERAVVTTLKKSNQQTQQVIKQVTEKYHQQLQEEKNSKKDLQDKYLSAQSKLSQTRTLLKQQTDSNSQQNNCNSQQSTNAKLKSQTSPSIDTSPVDVNEIVFIGTNGVNWITSDCGQTIQALGINLNLKEFQFHPTKKEWMLATSWTVCNKDKDDCIVTKDLYYTEDRGKNWKILTKYIVQFEWAIRQIQNLETSQVPIERIIYSKELGNISHQRIKGWNMKTHLYYSDDFLSTSHMIINQGNKFLLTEHFIFAAQVHHSENQIVKLLVANANSKEYVFSYAEVPEEIKQHSFTILDTSEGQVFLNINHYGAGSPLGTIYQSDSTGTRFSLSVTNNVRTLDGQCDFEKVNGVDGIYISNVYASKQAKYVKEQLSNKDPDTSDQDIPTEKQRTKGTSKSKQINLKDKINELADYIQTIITFDKGGVWQLIKAPAKNSLGQNLNCDISKKCSLHLHSVSSQLQFGPTYSSQNSVGLILATGNVGNYLSQKAGKINTYMSRNGGLSWEEIKKGSHIYEVGDHGSIIVMANDQDPTDQVFFSWDEGLTWNVKKISETPLMVSNIITEPGNTSDKFIVYGSVEGESDLTGVVIFLDFGSLHPRTCEGHDDPGTPASDYEFWEPHNPGETCLLGREMKYVRRKRDSACFNPENFERPVFVRKCECTESDWECDIGYKREKKNETGACVVQKGFQVNYNPPSSCSGYYTVSQGYRRIAGDQCFGGVDHESLRVPCPMFGFLTYNSFLYDLLLIVAMVGVFYFIIHNKEHILSFMATKNLDAPFLKLMSFFKNINISQPLGYEQAHQSEDETKQGGKKSKNSAPKYPQFDENMIVDEEKEPSQSLAERAASAQKAQISGIHLENEDDEELND